MKEVKVKLRHPKPDDINGIIELPAQLDRSLPPNRDETKNSR
jgi:hypothetical protein